MRLTSPFTAGQNQALIHNPKASLAGARRSICYPLGMGSTRALQTSTRLIIAAAFAIACSVHATGTTDSSQCRIDSDVLCPGDFVGYSCQGETKPAPTCSEGTLEFDGEVGYCCPTTDSCAIDASAAGCAENSHRN